jgi:hypothetical protein
MAGGARVHAFAAGATQARELPRNHALKHPIGLTPGEANGLIRAFQTAALSDRDPIEQAAAARTAR